MAGKIIMVFSAFPEKKGAEAACRRLVEKGIAACTSIIKVEKSIYRWKGKVCGEAEWMVMIKARESGRQRIMKGLEQGHPYEVPEILVFKVDGANRKYAEWLYKREKRNLFKH